MKQAGYPSFDVAGASLSTIAEAFRLFPRAGVRHFVRHGLATVDAAGNATIDSDRWYPLDPVLDVINEVLAAVGPNTMFEIGRNIPRHAQFPPDISDAFSALASANIAYHMNHRKNGAPMFDTATGRMLEGIGEFRIVSGPRARPVIIESDNVYPCELRHGLLTALATRFEPRAMVDHSRSRCERRGAPACTYVAKW